MQKDNNKRFNGLFRRNPYERVPEVDAAEGSIPRKQNENLESNVDIASPIQLEIQPASLQDEQPITKEEIKLHVNEDAPITMPPVQEGEPEILAINVEQGEESHSEMDDGLLEINICEVGKRRTKARVDLSWNIEKFKSSAFKDIYRKKNIRVIYAGKCLANEDIMGEAGIKEGVFVHISVTDNPNYTPRNSAPDGQTSDWDNDEQRGDADFARYVQENYGNGPNGVAEDDYQARPGNFQRDNCEFLMGFALGSILGFVMLLWVLQRNTPNTMKFGIMLGIAANIYVGTTAMPNQA